VEASGEDAGFVLMDGGALLILGPTLLFAFMNGASDSGTMVASLVSSGNLSPRRAALLAAACAFLGALLLGSAVAHTIGEQLVRVNALPPGSHPFHACVAAAAAALLWCSAAWLLGFPGSYTHAMLGGWLGAFMALGGPGIVLWRNAGIVLLGVLLTPLLGLVAAWIAMALLERATLHLSRKTLPLFRLAEVGAFMALCLAHGANAAQKSMALLVIAGFSLAGDPVPASFDLPPWVRWICSAAFSAGVLLGFSRILKTVGFHIFRVRPLHSFCALGTSMLLILSSTFAGLPLSPGQINSSCLLGAGAGHNYRRVRWDMAGDLLANWVLTFPLAAVLSFLIVKVVE